MEYKTSVPFRGSAKAAIHVARLQFMANGFKVEQPGESELAAIGPGMHSTKQNPILGVSRARIIVSANAINLHAELGGVKFMQRFVYIFPPALGFLLALVFACTPTMPRHAPLAAFVPVLPWLVLSPLLAGWVKRRTIKAVDTLVYNMANVR
jgi:hypothetical protein